MCPYIGSKLENDLYLKVHILYPVYYKIKIVPSWKPWEEKNTMTTLVSNLDKV
jgi:hypothetical protein